MRSEEHPTCPCCTGPLRVIGSRRRRIIQETGEKRVLMVRRHRCCHCHRIHHELPDIMVPYKRYGSASIEAVVTDERPLAVSCDESTIIRWKQWFFHQVHHFLGCFGSIAIQMGKNTAAAASSPLQRMYRFVGDAPGWLARVVRPTVNLNCWIHTHSASYATIRQRIDLQCKLGHLDRAQVGDDMKRHLVYAGADHEIFSDGAIDEIYRFSSGAARLINKVCTHCLLYGAQNQRRIIDDHMVKRVIQGELA
ncbi:DUF6431 domain-containing protein [Heliophilum fasciatum]|uniref:DUF6431 domain-containing protein n=1 Tax=Heliophilum fasciatum TaxID=35700 RepID=UPI0022261692|nr:DUF6431 domain-containing protein [Heliophilum fasciatum]